MKHKMRDDIYISQEKIVTSQIFMDSPTFQSTGNTTLFKSLKWNLQTHNMDRKEMNVKTRKLAAYQRMTGAWGSKKLHRLFSKEPFKQWRDKSRPSKFDYSERTRQIIWYAGCTLRMQPLPLPLKQKSQVIKLCCFLFLIDLALYKHQYRLSPPLSFMLTT